MWLISLFFFASYANAFPIESPVQGQRAIMSIFRKRSIGIDNSQDEWSQLIAGVAPLIFLLGERVTKQHLRESLSRADYYLLGAIPFGLVTSVVSLLRLVSLPPVTRLIGRSDELLQETCKEITPVNTGNINSILEDGRVQRGIVETQQGPTGVSTNTVTRLHVWEFCSSVAELSVEIGNVRRAMSEMDHAYKYSTDLSVPTHLALIVADIDKGKTYKEAIEIVKGLYGLGEADCDAHTIIQGTLSMKITAVGGEVNFVKGEVRSTASKIALVVASITSIFALHVASLVDVHFQVSVEWLFVVVGYLGLLLSVSIYAEAIRHRITFMSVQLGPHGPGSTYCALQNGNLDKEGTLGYALPVAQLGGVDVVQISCLREPTFMAQILGTVAGGAMLLSFLLHYLGLRSVQWWVSVCELAICFIMIGIRTMAARTPHPFVQSNCLYDTDLRSVGVIRASGRKRASITDEPSPYHRFQSLRMHFGIRKMGPKTEGDLVAALLASKLCEMDPQLRKHVFDKIGFAKCQVQRFDDSVPSYVIIHCGGCGLLTKEGFVRPRKPLVWSQEFTLHQVREESLIGWAINGLNRNEDLQLLPEFKDSTSQAVYITAVDSLVDWWLRSEGSNEWQYNIENLHWSGALALSLLLCELATTGSSDEEFANELDILIQDAKTEATLISTLVAQDLAEALEKIAVS